MKNKLFLLSIEEYKKYKVLIPKRWYWWWLRSAGVSQYRMSGVDCDGSVDFVGNNIFIDYGVHPAFKSAKIAQNIAIGDVIDIKENVWIYLGDDLFISKYAVAFSKFDDESNEYNNSYIKNVTLKKLEDKLFDKDELELIDDWIEVEE